MNNVHRAAICLAASAAVTVATGVALPTAIAEPIDLTPMFSSTLIANGATTSVDRRLFLPIQPVSMSDPQVVEVRDGVAIPYPDQHWNSWRHGADASGRFVGVNSIRIGPDGDLWAVDRGTPGGGQPVVPGGAKLVRINLATNEAVHTYDLSQAIRAWSFVDDVRFNGSHAYLTDAGSPGLIVLDLGSGIARRVLDGHPSTIAQTPLLAEERALTTATGRPVNIHADQLEVSPDGMWLYYQPASGGLSRIATRYLDDPSLPADEMAQYVEHFADTPSTGGTAIDANGTIYLSDVDTDSIVTVSPTGVTTTLVTDPRLAWVDAMWIDDAGDLLLPAAQINRLPMYNGGVNAVQEPVTLYRAHIGVAPVRR